jgi:hypothetical protein
MSINIIRMTHVLADCMIRISLARTILPLVLILVLLILLVEKGLVLNEFPWNTHITQLPISLDVSARTHVVEVYIIELVFLVINLL